ncbi:MAG TPA: hypothetical protein VK819_15440 [Acidobacteriaceae bacterium]|jgi:hypothetical protein|nr:hypothetical protein [Acidobacteriaceae bacterium]
MNKKLSWLAAAVYFLFMLACYLGFSVLNPALRHQMASIHSLYWTFAMPVAAGCCAIFALAMRFIAGLLAKRYSARSTS